MPEKIEHRVGVLAAAELVWEIIADIPGWPEWSPMYPEAAGRIGYGERLELTLALPGLPPERIQASVLDWTPYEALHWRTRLWRGFAWAVRYLEVEAMSDSGCIFSNGELYGGLVGSRVLRRRRGALRAAFTGFGEAVKVRAETLFRERSGAEAASAPNEVV